MMAAPSRVPRSHVGMSAPEQDMLPAAMEPRSAEAPQRTLAQRIWKVLREELGPLHLRLLIAGLLVRLLPHLAFQRVRTLIYRCAGISIGPRSLLAGPLALIGSGPIASHLRIGSDCWFNSPLFADLTGTVDIGDHVTIGHHVVFITANHRIGPARRRAGSVEADGIRIGDGAWIGAGVTLLPGASVGAGSVIGAGSLVTAAVPPGVVAFGRPARVIRSIDEERDAEVLAGPARRARA
jgi:maltose O-acetyltransferase